jgi:hypothetical protein
MDLKPWSRTVPAGTIAYSMQIDSVLQNSLVLETNIYWKAIYVTDSGKILPFFRFLYKVTMLIVINLAQFIFLEQQVLRITCILFLSFYTEN